MATSGQPNVFIATRENDWEHHWEQQEYYDADSGHFLGATLWDDGGSVRVYKQPTSQPSLEISLDRKNCKEDSSVSSGLMKCDMSGLFVDQKTLIPFRTQRSLECTISDFDGTCYFSSDLGRPSTKNGKQIEVKLPWGTVLKIDISGSTGTVSSSDLTTLYKF